MNPYLRQHAALGPIGPYSASTQRKNEDSELGDPITPGSMGTAYAAVNSAVAAVTAISAGVAKAITALSTTNGSAALLVVAKGRGHNTADTTYITPSASDGKPKEVENSPFEGEILLQIEDPGLFLRDLITTIDSKELNSNIDGMVQGGASGLKIEFDNEAMQVHFHFTS